MSAATELRPEARTAIAAVAIDRRGSLAALGQFPDDDLPTVTLWEVPAMQPAGRLDRPDGEAAVRLSFDTTGTSLAVVDTHPRLAIHGIGNDEARTIDLDMDVIHDARFAKDADRIVIAGSQVEVRSGTGHRTLWTLDNQPGRTGKAAPIAADISPDGRLVAVSVPGSRAVDLYNPEKDGRMGALQGGPDAAGMVRLDPTGRFVAAVDSNGGAAYVWDLEATDLIEIGVLADALGEYLCIGFDDQGTRLALGSAPGVLTVVSIPEGDILLDERILEGRITDLAFAPVSDQVLVGCEDGIARWVNLS